MKVPITRPYFDDCEKETIIKPLQTGWLVQGPFVREFEEGFKSFVGAAHACATSNCTTALQLALTALGIKEGDTVVVPSLTYVATANAVESTGAEVLFCDINLDTFSIDTEELEALLKSDRGKSIRAVIPVNLFGLCADLPRVVSLARRQGAWVIEDSACGFGALLDGRHSGTFGDYGCFSFHPRKAITTGEGGMVVSNEEELINRIRVLRDHGASASDLERHRKSGGSLLPEFKVRGFNYRMTDLQGALGVCQIRKADYMLGWRRKIASRYDEELKSLGSLKTPFIPEGYVSGYQSYVCLYTGGGDPAELDKDSIDRLNVERNRLMTRLEEQGIGVRQGTHAVHTLEFYRKKYGLEDEQYLWSYAADRLSIALPLYTEMKDDAFDYVVHALRDLVP